MEINPLDVVAIFQASRSSPLPRTLRCLRHANHVSKRTHSRFQYPVQSDAGHFRASFQDFLIGPALEFSISNLVVFESEKSHTSRIEHGVVRLRSSKISCRQFPLFIVVPRRRRLHRRTQRGVLPAQPHLELGERRGRGRVAPDSHLRGTAGRRAGAAAAPRSPRARRRRRGRRRRPTR